MLLINSGANRALPPVPERRRMTVCIAAICEWTTKDPKIVLCSDKRSSSTFGKLDNRFKLNPLSAGFTLMCAGNEDEISAVTRLVATAFRDATAEGIALDETNIGRLVDDALAARKRSRVENLVQSRYAISYDEFRETGRERFPDDLFRNLMYEIHEVAIDIALILAGFVDDSPLILEANRSSHAVIRDDFSTIGSGAPLAQSVLLGRQHHTQNTLAQTAYTVFEAKKYAEGEVGVGEEYAMIVMAKDDRVTMLSAKGKDWLDETYEICGPKPIPNDLSVQRSSFLKLSSEAELIAKLNEPSAPAE